MACAACGKPMNAAAAQCPHCGAIRAGAGGGLAGVALSPEEVRALLAVETGRSPADAGAPGVFGALVLPHPLTRGRARVAELALTALGVPVIMSGFFGLALLIRTYYRSGARGGSELQKLGLVTGTGGPMLWWVLTMFGVSTGAALGWAGGSVAALVSRYWLRQSASRGRAHRDLFRVDPTDKPRAPRPPRRASQPPPPALPPARVHSAVPAPISEPPPSPADGDNPRFLK